MDAIIGTKIGMTQIFLDKGVTVPVTVVSAGPCVVIQKKTVKTNGYNAIQVGYKITKEKLVTKSVLGHLKKAGANIFARLKEFRVEEPDKYEIGQEIKSDIFSVGDFVDVQGISKGHGFQGVVTRHGFGGGPQTHGQSDKLRAPGAIGPQRPQRVLKGTRMAGRMGGESVTVQELEIVKTIPEKNILLIKGAVPGVKNSEIFIFKTIKKTKAKQIVKKEVKKEEKREVKKEVKKK